MDRYELQKLRDLPIEGVAGRLGMEVTRHAAICPFHTDHHPSLQFNRARNTFRCFVCGASGGAIDLVMRQQGLGFRDACRWLAEKNDIILSESDKVTAPLSPQRGDGDEAFCAQRYARYFIYPCLSEAAKRFLYEERRIDPRVVQWCRLTSWRDRMGGEWLQIPYYDRDGHLIGIQNRNLLKGATPRFRFPRGSRCGIYNLPVLNLLKPGEELWITEGCSDCWAMLSAGHKAIAIPSATLLKPGDVEQLSALNSQLSTVFHMYPDNDVPGERLFLQLQEKLPSLVRHRLPPGCKDYAEYFLKTL